MLELLNTQEWLSYYSLLHEDASELRENYDLPVEPPCRDGFLSMFKEYLFRHDWSVQEKGSRDYQLNQYRLPVHIEVQIKSTSIIYGASR